MLKGGLLCLFRGVIRRDGVVAGGAHVAGIMIQGDTIILVDLLVAGATGDEH